jgi:hypothetical protein
MIYLKKDLKAVFKDKLPYFDTVKIIIYDTKEFEE